MSEILLKQVLQAITEMKEENGKQFTAINKRLESIDKRLDNIEPLVESMHTGQEKIFQEINNIKYDLANHEHHLKLVK